MTKASLLSRDLPFIVLAVVTERLAGTLSALAATAVVATRRASGRSPGCPLAFRSSPR